MIDLPALRRRVILELRKEWPEGSDEECFYAAMNAIHCADKLRSTKLQFGERGEIGMVRLAAADAEYAKDLAHAVGSDAWAWLPAVVEDARCEVEGE